MARTALRSSPVTRLVVDLWSEHRSYKPVQAFLEGLEAEGFEVEVVEHEAYPAHWEIAVHVLESVEDRVLDVIAALALRRLKRWVPSRGSERVVTIYGPKEQPLREVVVKSSQPRLRSKKDET